MPFESADVESARVDNRSAVETPRDLRGLCEEIGLGWHRARQLWTTGLLSFDPDAAGLWVDAARQAEFLFLGRLAAVGLSADTITAMVRGLRRPYAYDLGRISFDWRDRQWRATQAAPDPEAAFFELLARLDPRREGAVLLEIREMVESALDLARGRRDLYHHAPLSGVSLNRHYTAPLAERTEQDCAS